MSLSLLDKAKRNFSLRLTIWYTVVSLLAYTAIFTIAYYSLFSSLKKEDAKVIFSKFKEYKKDYDENGLLSVQSKIALERNYEKPVHFFVRIADQNNHTLLLALPDQLHGIDLIQIRSIDTRMKPQQIKIKIENFETMFEIHTFPLHDGNLIQIGKEINHREELLIRFRQIFFAIMIPAILLAIVGGYLVTFRALLPVRQLTNTIKSIVNTGEMGARVPSKRIADELGELVMLFNSMLERIERLIEVIKESLDNVAHDLRTPMARLRGLTENALASNLGIEECRETLSDCMEESERIIKMLNALMDISEAKAGTLKLYKERVDISKIVKETAEVYRFIAEEKNITIDTDLLEDVIVFADKNRIRQAVGNLLDNAVKYTPTGGIVKVKTYKKTQKEIIIEVSDNGIGIDEKDLPKIWERLYRAEQSRSQQGLGLGLSLVKSIVELHNGYIEVSSKLNSGSTFLICLPALE